MYNTREISRATKKLIHYNVMIRPTRYHYIDFNPYTVPDNSNTDTSEYILSPERERERYPSITRNKRFLRTIFKPRPSNRAWPTIFSPFLATVLIFSTPWVLVNVGQTRATCIFRQSANLFVPWAFVNAFVTYLSARSTIDPVAHVVVISTLDDGQCTRSFTRSGNGSGRA